MVVSNTIPRRMTGVALASFSVLLLLSTSNQPEAQERHPASAHAQTAPHETLASFHSDDELRAFLKERFKHIHTNYSADAVMMSAPAAAPAQGAMAENSVQSVVVTAARSSPGITNNQEVNVDEGDIVKVHGDDLVILRRGRLFTISLAHRGMRPIDSIDAYPPGVDARDDWYDEMLVSGDRVIVIGYSYARGGTEINRFRIDTEGHLGFEDAYQLRSNDYYSSRNYASRLVGHDLILYSPLYLSPWGPDPLEELPALRRWSGDASAGFRRIVGAQQIYIPEILRTADDIEVNTLHTVTNCDLSAPVLNCNAMSVLGPESRSYYVSSNAVYVWVSESWPDNLAREHAPGLLYRLPVDGGRPSALGVRGAPVDQFGFREDARSGVLNVLVRSEGSGDAMWRPEFTDGSVALLSVPIGDFGTGWDELASRHYRMLPRPRGSGYDFHDRFVGNYVLYGNGNGWGEKQDNSVALSVVPVHGGPVSELALSHGVDRIEAMGDDAVVIGSNTRDLTFTPIELTDGAPHAGARFVEAQASEGETRSHAFFFNPDPTADARDDGSPGVIGLPVSLPARPAYRQLFDSSAAMTFVRRSNRHFTGLGELAASSEGIADDNCVASCVDWYGNARPIFLWGRTFALLGYELVEGRLDDKFIHETARITFAPASRPTPRTPS